MKKFIKIFLLSFIAMIFVFSLVNVVFGASTANIACDKYHYPWCSAQDKGLGGDKGLINTIYNYSLVLVGVVALGAIIYGGILYTMSAGNPSGQTEATQWITGAIWGLILLLGAALLFNTINPEIVSLKLPPLDKVEIKNDIASTTPGVPLTPSGKSVCSTRGYKRTCSQGESGCDEITIAVDDKNGEDTGKTTTIFCSTSSSADESNYSYMSNTCNSGWSAVSDTECSSRNLTKPSVLGSPNTPSVCCKLK